MRCNAHRAGMGPPVFGLPQSERDRPGLRVGVQHHLVGVSRLADGPTPSGCPHRIPAGRRPGPVPLPGRPSRPARACHAGPAHGRTSGAPWAHPLARGDALCRTVVRHVPHDAPEAPLTSAPRPKAKTRAVGACRAHRSITAASFDTAPSVSTRSCRGRSGSRAISRSAGGCQDRSTARLADSAREVRRFLHGGLVERAWPGATGR